MPTLSNGLGNMASVCIMLVVTACFASLWPTIFYPMIKVGLNLGGNEASWEKKGSPELMLPPRVREAMKSSPIRESAKVPRKVVAGPQFYSGHDKLTKAENKGPNSAMNVIMPVYTLIVIFFFIFIMIRMGLKGKLKEVPSSVTMNLHKQCDQCQHSNNTLGPYPSAPGVLQRNRNPFVNTASYRAMSYLGKGAPSKSMHSLLSDVQTFRNHLAIAKVIKHKLDQLELARKAAVANNIAVSEQNVNPSDEGTEEKQIKDHSNFESHLADQLTMTENRQGNEDEMRSEKDQQQDQDVHNSDIANELLPPRKRKGMPLSKRSNKNRCKLRKARKQKATNIENVPPIQSKTEVPDWSKESKDAEATKKNGPLDPTLVNLVTGCFQQERLNHRHKSE